MCRSTYYTCSHNSLGVELVVVLVYRNTDCTKSNCLSLCADLLHLQQQQPGRGERTLARGLFSLQVWTQLLLTFSLQDCTLKASDLDLTAECLRFSCHRTGLFPLHGCTVIIQAIFLLQVLIFQDSVWTFLIVCTWIFCFRFDLSLL
jgi:hypothetical protein